MNNKYFKGSIYLANPIDIQIDNEISTLNAEKPIEEYEALLMSIQTLGQLQPVYLYKGLLVNGRHRRKVAIELDVKLECIEVRDDISKKELIELCNINEFNGRSLSITQKAFRAAEMIRTYGYTQSEAMKKLAVKDRSILTSANFILNNPTYKKLYAEDLKDGKSIRIDLYDIKIDKPYFGKSLRKIESLLKALEEANLKPNTPEEKAENNIDYNSLIFTERGKIEFWEKESGLSIEQKVDLIDYMNMKWNKHTAEDYINKYHKSITKQK